ncbi:MAG: hypothetical protein ACFFCS_21620, partial [Candidatus Hodarchaeota archaeon]
KHRGILSLILIAIAAYFFPDPSRLFQKGINTIGVTPEMINNYIIERIEQLVEKYGEDILASSEENPDEMRIIAEYKQLTKFSDIHPKSNAFYYIGKVFDYLSEQRLVTKQDGLYLPTISFKYQMEELCVNEHFIQFMKYFKGVVKEEVL